MPRIPYKSIDLAEPKELVDAIRQRRGGSLLNLDRVLLHSPAFAKGWNAFLGEVRTGLDLSPKLRELAMCVVAVLNGAAYEFHHHAPEFIKAGGNALQVEAIQGLNRADVDTSLFASLFDEAEQAAIQLTMEMTRQVAVSDHAFAKIHAALHNDQHVMELIGVIAAYNMVSRILVALQVEPESV